MSQVNTKSSTARITNPAHLIPGSVEAIQSLIKSVQDVGAPPAVLELVHLRASQLNGCSFCVNLAWKGRKTDEAHDADERLFMVSAWREAANFTDAERAALALAEAMTRLADQSDPVPDESGRKRRVTTTKRCWPHWSCGSPQPTFSTASTSLHASPRGHGVRPGCSRRRVKGTNSATQLLRRLIYWSPY